MEMFMCDMKAVHFYTGLENYEKFLFVYDTLGSAVDNPYSMYTVTRLNFFDNFETKKNLL